MDLGKIKRKVENKEYSRFSQFEDDFRLMLRNCFQYNGPGTYVYDQGVILEGLFEKELASIRGKEHEETQNMTIVESPITTPRDIEPTPVSAPVKIKSVHTTVSSEPLTASKPAPIIATSSSTIPSSLPPVVKDKLPKIEQPQRKKSITPVEPVDNRIRPGLTEKQLNRMSEKEKMEAVLLNTMTDRHAYEFLRPVDPIKQGIPHYAQIIKTPMDLGKIKSRFKNNQYPNAQAMDSDMRLMFRNCYTFNPPNTYVYDESKQLEEVYDREWGIYFGNIARRGSTELKKPKETKPSSPSTTVTTVTSSTASPAIKIRTHPEKTKILMTSPSTSSSKSPKSSKPPKANGISAATHTSPAAHSTTSTDHTVTPPPPPAPVPDKISSEEVRSKPTVTNPAMNESNRKRCDRVLKKLWAHQASQPFYEPVDAVALNIPQYYEVIKRPMDLSAIRKKYDNHQYVTIWDLERDIRQIFWNCYSFNDHESWVAKQCQALETFFNQIWSAEFAHSNALKGEEKRIAQKVVNKLTFHDAAALFNEPVDLESLPDYGLVIKHPMDLRTIWEKLESGKYTSLKAVDHDVRLVFKNCYDYNAPGTYGNDQGKKLEKYYQNISREMRARITAASSSSASPGTSSTVASSSIGASPKRPHSSSPAPVKLTSSNASPTTATESHPSPAKKLKAIHHNKSETPAINTLPPAEPMDIDPVVLKSPTVFNSPTVVKSPKSPVKMKSPSVPMKSPSTVAKSPTTDMPAKLHPTLLSKMESLLIKMMNRKESFGFLDPVSVIFQTTKNDIFRLYLHITIRWILLHLIFHIIRSLLRSQWILEQCKLIVFNSFFFFRYIY